MKTVNHYNHNQLLNQMQSKWKFRIAPLAHDIPIPIYEVLTEVGTITIPLETLTPEETYQINHILRKQSKEIYLQDNEGFLGLFPSNDIDVFEELNAMFFDVHLKWIVCSSVVLSGQGISLTFGGEKLIAILKETFVNKENWITMY